MRTFSWACACFSLWIIIVGFTPCVRADGPAMPPANAGEVSYRHDIRPLLSDRCYKCHGPDEAQRQAGLRLDVAEGFTAKTDSGAVAILAGKSAESEVLQRITSSDPALKMPPPDSGKTLTEQEIELIRRWIDSGAPVQQHWSFVAPTRPEPPTVANESWAKNPLDRFILDRLNREKLTPAPSADKVTLIRRVTQDLTGLPPTVAEIDAFLADESPEAYEKLVDRLLASPRYGEHQARYWLDAARYGDTHGLHLDNERSMWKYRDWVIDAYNNNQPYDQFVIEQLAGDLLPEPTPQQKIATGFNRCNVTTGEGGSIDEEVLVRYAVDRVETTATVFLGLTAGCAVCHDHKYDPLTQKEFYQLFAFFYSTQDAAMDGNQLLPPPSIKIASAEQEQKRRELDERLTALRTQISEKLASTQYTDPGPPADTKLGETQEFVWIEDDLPAEAKPEGGWEFVTAPAPVHSGEKSHKRTATGLSQHFFTGAKIPLKVGAGDKLFAYVFLDPANPPKEIMLQWNDGQWEHRAYWGENVIPWGADNSGARYRAGDLPEAGKWVRLEVEAAQVGLNPGANINGWAFTQHDGTVHWDKAGIVTKTPQGTPNFESQIVWEEYAKSSNELPQPVKDALKIEADKRDDAQKKAIREHFLQYVHPQLKETFTEQQSQITATQKERDDLENSIPSTLVMADMENERETRLLIRGQYDKKGDKVGRALPAWLPPLPAGAPLNRLGLAKWLVDPSHPLMARVTVNRLWQQFFGQGLVKTAEDFGAQGQLPTHPELLDWLAVEFRESGWNVKHLLKLIVTSQAYRQSSAVTPELVQRDPTNELFARGPRFRLDAEGIRDAALFVSGLMVEKIGGKSVKPLQPEGLWEAVGFIGSNTREFKPDAGEALYRRSMYTFWKRTAPPPNLLTFDAPSREYCTVRRARTNTPLQALTLLNDQQFVEASRFFAERILSEGGANPAERLAWAYRSALGRKPTEVEAAVLQRVLDRQLEIFKGDVESAKKLLAVGPKPANAALDPAEHAAYTLVANLILNLDEFVTKE
ncbi:MAG: PSD1 and planctomycete cytochrome C domain-containing protein [Pirellulales bacterium]|nr:PSD1 and planctomycete cytochrome C domain-containing protein [Pirellulales bacterium]